MGFNVVSCECSIVAKSVYTDNTDTVWNNSSKGGLGRQEDVVEVVVHELHALVEARLVVPVQVREVDLQPAQPALAEHLRLVEQEQPATQVVADVVQMRRDGVRPAAEVDVVREVDGIAKELDKSFSSSKRRQRKKGGRLRHGQSRPCS